MLTIVRDGREMDINVSIDTLDEEQEVAAGSVESVETLGLSVQTLTPQLAEQFGLEAGQGGGYSGDARLSCRHGPNSIGNGDSRGESDSRE